MLNLPNAPVGAPVDTAPAAHLPNGLCLLLIIVTSNESLGQDLQMGRLLHSSHIVGESIMLWQWIFLRISLGGPS